MVRFGEKILKTSDYFKIKDIVVRGINTIDMSYLKGENIFGIDLQKESRYISAHHPTYHKIRLIRVLPNRVFINFVERKPVGIIKLYKYFCVDSEGTVFNVPEQLEDPDLPLILGLETKIFGPRQGEKYNIRELTLALNIIKETNINAALKDYEIKKIDVTNPGNASFFILENLEIKIGEDNIRGKISILPSLLTQARNDLPDIKYIDLRFKEPVIKPKDK